MRSAVAREEGDGDIVVREDMDGGGWGAPGSSWIDRRDGDVAWKLLEASATNNAD